jgi:SAM-dependent methyltransferase
VTPVDLVLDALRTHGGNPKRNGANWQAKCPAHDDRVASLSISEGDDGRVLFHCHAGCSFDKICADLGLEPRDLFPADRARTTGDDFGTITARYVYTDEDGKPLFRVNRTSTKKFWQERSDGNGDWIKGLGKTRRVLYRLPSVREAITKGETIYIVEGEKDADAGARAGICTTTSAMGSGKWNRKEYSEALRGAGAIVLVADDDKEGAKHVEQVGRHLRRHGNRGEITIAKAKTGKDLFDHLAAGHTIDELQVIARSNRVSVSDETESPAPGATDDQGGDEKATQPPGNSDDEDTGDSEAPDLPDLELDPDQAASVEKLMEQLKGLDPENKKSFLGELMKLAGKQSSQATDLVDLAKEAGVDLWHDGDGIGYASAPVGDHVEHWPVRSRAFRMWLRRRCYDEKETAAGGNAVKDATDVLEGLALFTGTTHDVQVRIAEWHGAVYLDLCDDDWRCVEITANGWTVRNGAPVRFIRRGGMRALPIPEPGNITELRSFLNVTDDEWPLVLGWLVGAFHPHGPYTVLDVTGEHGCAKTTLGRVLRRCIDPNKAELRGAPRDTQDLAIAANNGWVCAFDNLSSLWRRLSDDLARLATGAGFGTRKLYENDEEQLFDARRPVIVNGIEDVVTQPDLLDRTIIVHPPRIKDKDRQDEKAFWASFEAARPRILGALCDAVTLALARRDSIVLESPPRMADFAIWVQAAEPALGLDEGKFLAAYTANRRLGQSLALEADEAVGAIHAFVMRRRTWTGSAGELAGLLKPEKPPKGWPTSPQGMAETLKRGTSILRAHDVEVVRHEKARPRRWTLTARTEGEEEENGESGDAGDEVSETPSDLHERPDTSGDTGADTGDGGDRAREPGPDPDTSPSGGDGAGDGPDTPSDLRFDTSDTSDTSSATSASPDDPEEEDLPPAARDLAQLTIDGGRERITLDGKPADGVPRHPARFSDEILPVIAAAVPPAEYPRVLDPFAGVGRIHDLGNLTVGVEIEPEWARARPGTIVANALALPFPDESFDAVATSPTYGNRLADHHEARDGSVRHSYTHDLGRKLHPNNSGAMHWGPEYRTFHSRAWASVVRVLRPGGRFVLNVSDHIRDHERKRVTDWHVETLTKLGLHEIDRVDVPTKRMRYGANADARVDAEHVITFEKPIR